MKSKKIKNLNKTIGLAAMAGMRSMSAPALLSDYLKEHPSRRLRNTPLYFMQSEKAATIFKILAAIEMLGDKSPSAPDRIKPSSLLVRGLSGALVGATLSRARRKRNVGGGAVGFISALASSYIIYYLRKKLAKNSLIPDPVLGFLEDLLVVKGGQRLFQR